MKKILLITAIVALAFSANAQQAPKPNIQKPPAIVIKPMDTTQKATVSTKATPATKSAATLYNPAADAKAEIAAAVKTAAAQHKNVLLQIGGNWCSWCLLFNGLVTKDNELNKYMNDNYVVLHVNYSKENMNEKVLADLGYPQRFGFPVFVILDGKGARLHTQNSSYLEEGHGHSRLKVLEFFENWSPKALDPKSYEVKAK